MTDYTTKTKVELIALCKEKGIKGYATNGITKDKIIEIIKEFEITGSTITEGYNGMKYNDILALCRKRNIKGLCKKGSTGTVNLTKEIMIKLLKDNTIKTSLFDYITNNNSTIIKKYAGNIEDLKIILPFTNKYYNWKCDTPQCSNIFEAITSNIFKKEKPRKYCNMCSYQNKMITTKKAILNRSGTIHDKFPFIEDIWSNENKKNPNDFAPGSNEKIFLKCPNISVKHPDYKISVYKIQDHNRFKCPKCNTKTSKAEMKIYSELKYTFKDVKWQHKIEGREADITIEDLKLVIEVDGYPWHKGKNKNDLEKNAIFEKYGYSVLRIRDSRLDEILCNNIICNIVKISVVDYNRIIEWINNTLKCNIDKYEEWKNSEYYNKIQVSKMTINYENSIEYLFPESKEIWDYDKNYPFIPSQFSKGSCMEIWLKCSSGHSWKRQIWQLFRNVKDKKYIMKCPECRTIKSNKHII
jgi:very-short-patch-repair endonuclease